jgi:hypothetical protein
MSDVQENLLRVSMMHLSLLVDVLCGGIFSMRWLLSQHMTIRNGTDLLPGRYGSQRIRCYTFQFSTMQKEYREEKADDLIGSQKRERQEQIHAQ